MCNYVGLGGFIWGAYRSPAGEVVYDGSAGGATHANSFGARGEFNASNVQTADPNNTGKTGNGFAGVAVTRCSMRIAPMPPISGFANGARPEYLATFRASFRITSPPSNIHSPFAPSVWNAQARCHEHCIRPKD